MSPGRAMPRAGSTQNPSTRQGSLMRRVEKLFRPSEIYAMGLSLLEREQAAARERRLDGNAHGGSVSPLKPVRGRSSRAKVSHDLKDRTFDRIAAHWGISGRQLEKIRDVCEAAAADPDRFAPLLEEMDRTGKVNGPHTKLLRLRDEIRILDLAPVAGRFRTLVVDPPWQEDNISESCGHDYATMPFEDILAVPVRDWAEDDCHLYLWGTNNTLITRAPQLLVAWGFEPKTIVTWTKPDLGFGRYFRNTTEHFIFAVRGDLRTRSAGRSTRTDHDWPVGANSEKPEGFYDLVRACSYPPYGEAFQRLTRPDFVNLYQAPAAVREAAE